MNKYEDALDWLIWHCIAKNEYHEDEIVYERIKNFFIEPSIKPLRELIERATPTKLRKTSFTRRCPSCNRQMSNSKNAHLNIKFCPNCGQALDWSKGE